MEPYNSNKNWTKYIIKNPFHNHKAIFFFKKKSELFNPEIQ